MATDSPLAASKPSSDATAAVGGPEFRFVTNHGNVLLLIARDQHIRIRDIASLLDITERAAQRIVADLSNAGYIEREREGRRNVYSLKTGLPLHLPFQDDLDIDALLSIMPVVEPTSSPGTQTGQVSG
jgi:DNA-binding transcriptional ArsR family regulator